MTSGGLDPSLSSPVSHFFPFLWFLPLVRPSHLCPLSVTDRHIHGTVRVHGTWERLYMWACTACVQEPVSVQDKNSSHCLPVCKSKGHQNYSVVINETVLMSATWPLALTISVRERGNSLPVIGTPVAGSTCCVFLLWSDLEMFWSRCMSACLDLWWELSEVVAARNEFFTHCSDLSGWMYVPKVSCYFLSSMSCYNFWCTHRKTRTVMKWVASKLNSLVFLIEVSDKSGCSSNNSTCRSSVKSYCTSWRDISLIKDTLKGSVLSLGMVIFICSFYNHKTSHWKLICGFNLAAKLPKPKSSNLKNEKKF